VQGKIYNYDSASSRYLVTSVKDLQIIKQSISINTRYILKNELIFNALASRGEKKHLI